MMYVRLVYLFHEKRKELMMIYAEDIAKAALPSKKFAKAARRIFTGQRLKKD